MNTFQELNLPAALQEALVRMNYTTPTEIQARAIPIAIEGHDILGSAQTGTGKTAAFSIPLINRLIEDPEATALILTPTRELAEQVITVLHQLLNKRRDIKTALLIGGMPIQKQFLRLKERPRVIVGTPGRINDHLDRRSLNFSNNRILVLDEADRMLDMGFGEQLEAIAKHLPQDRQTFMFSATIPKRIISLADKFLKSPQRIKVGATHAPLAKIKQDVVRTSEESKYSSLLKELDKRSGSVIIFAKTKRRVDLLAKKLNEKIGAGAMHGDLRQHQRTRILKEFRDQKYRVLVATDVAARGLDIPHIEHVINYDLPQAPEDYIHRIGRTARGLAEGSALCFISREDEKYWRAIERLLGGDESAPGVRYAPSKGRPAARPKARFGDRPSSERRSYDQKPGARNQKPGFKKRFNDGPSDRPQGSEFKKHFENGSSSRPQRPEFKKRFEDSSSSRPQRPEFKKRFEDGSNSRPQRPEFKKRFEDGSNSRPQRPEFKKRFADSPNSREQKPEFKKRFSDNPHSREQKSTFSRDTKPGFKKQDAKPAPKRINPSNKSYGPQNRPPKTKKQLEELLLG